MNKLYRDSTGTSSAATPSTAGSSLTSLGVPTSGACGRARVSRTDWIEMELPALELPNVLELGEHGAMLIEQLEPATGVAPRLVQRLQERVSCTCGSNVSTPGGKHGRILQQDSGLSAF
jgi:hypothetical protein